MTISVKFEELPSLTYSIDGQGLCTPHVQPGMHAAFGTILGENGEPLAGLRVVGCGAVTYSADDGAFYLPEIQERCNVQAFDCLGRVVGNLELRAPASGDLLDVHWVVSVDTACPIGTGQNPPELDFAYCVLMEGESILGSVGVPASAQALAEHAERLELRHQALTPDQWAYCEDLKAAFLDQEAETPD